MPVVLAPAAADDLEDIGDYIRADNPPAAARFIAALRERCSNLDDAPRGSRLRPELWPGLRSVPFHNYIIFYTSSGDQVRVERILHGARDIEAVFGQGN